MILLTAILIGLLAGMVRAELGKRHYRVVPLQKPGLVFLAFIPQLIVFQLPHVGIIVQDQWVSIVLISSQIILLLFIVLNWKKPGFILLGLGTTLNLTTMLLNGGLMPMSPSTIKNLYPNVSSDSWQVGQHLWNSKNIVLTEEMTCLPILSDRFIIPSWSPYRVAFSMGDLALASGAFWLFWSLGGKSKQHKEFNHESMEYNHSPIRKNRGKSTGKGVLQNTYRRSH